MTQRLVSFYIDNILNDELIKIATEKGIAFVDVIRDFISVGKENKDQLEQAKKLLQRALSDFYEEDESWANKADQLLGRRPRKSYQDLINENKELNDQIAKQKSNDPEAFKNCQIGLDDLTKISGAAHVPYVSKFDEVLTKACSEPSLVEALSWIAIWENDRAVKQALKGERDPNSGGLWDTCFLYCFKAVIEGWEKKHSEKFIKITKTVRPEIQIDTDPRPGLCNRWISDDPNVEMPECSPGKYCNNKAEFLHCEYVGGNPVCEEHKCRCNKRIPDKDDCEKISQWPTEYVNDLLSQAKILSKQSYISPTAFKQIVVTIELLVNETIKNVR